MTKIHKRSKSLASGRPPSATQRAALSSSATRTIIRSHHKLHKQLHKARADNDNETINRIEQQIDSLGGLHSYQQASILGQARDRGGDSSVVLMQWLQLAKNEITSRPQKPRLLEVGALSTNNACSRSQLFDIERIDLNSQAHDILQQDFMLRPLPVDDTEKFDLISLSLVVNYVPDAVQRGEMLRRTCQFLLNRKTDGSSELPALFFVLPAPCVFNSRYLNEKLLTDIMECLGYTMLARKHSAKLIYYLWQYHGIATNKIFRKTEVNAGAARNNFSIVLNSKDDKDLG